MSENILIIEDDKLVLGTLKRFLRKEGYGVSTAESGQEALEKIKNEKFNLIISDIRMPGLDGIDTLKLIREYLAVSNRDLIPELLITGYANEENRKKADELRVSGYLAKPFDLKDLLWNIKNSIKKS